MSSKQHLIQQKGKLGELIAVDYLKNKGYSILTRNFYTRYGELDIVCEREFNLIVFCEVKHYKKHAMVSPLNYILYHQRKKIVLAAQLYLSKLNLSKLNLSKPIDDDFNFRFDIVIVQEGRVSQHLQNVDYSIDCMDC